MRGHWDTSGAASNERHPRTKSMFGMGRARGNGLFSGMKAGVWWVWGWGNCEAWHHEEWRNTPKTKMGRGGTFFVQRLVVVWVTDGQPGGAHVNIFLISVGIWAGSVGI